MDEDNYCIYKHTSPSGKSYIGMTKQGEKRFGKDGNGYKNQKKFYNAIKKYGWNNFQHEIIEDHLSFEQACFGEQMYIEIYDSIDNGYNIYVGGEGAQEVGNKPIVQLLPSLEPVNIFKSVSYCTKELGFKSFTTVSNWCKDNQIHCGYYWRFLEDCKDIDVDSSKFYGDFVNPQYLDFDPYSDKLDKLHFAKPGKRSNGKKKINQYTMQGQYIRTWDSIKEAALYYNMPNDSPITRAIKNNFNCFGYRWKYYDGNIENITPNITKNKRILQFDKNGLFLKEFPNAHIAELETGVKKGNICRVCNGERASSGGYIWKYKENMSDADLDKMLAELD